ncbi:MULTISPECIES: sensor domain-containing phosphodiesterase [Halomonadaceae]|uniref:EAL domain-containing protein n=1 Tax=Vreelandella halophila TaxID=86177 RepID=A0A9X4YEA5_9GAMM|nr:MULTISPECIES: EAL domain-containing protein [Halomonas]MYL28116.1 EAL domain-containing protein [Halomonas utahensis]MYL75882.1 EAL domain-containing protein [Halomonas sp. 22501_18_FS]
MLPTPSTLIGAAQAPSAYGPVSTHWRSPLGWITLALVLIASAEASRWFTIGDQSMSALWPPAGIFIGATAALGYRALLVLTPVFFIWLLWLDGSPPVLAALAATGQCLGAATGAFLIRRFWRLGQKKGPFSELIALYTRAALAGGLVTSLFGAVGYRLGSSVAGAAALHDTVFVYLAFEALGIILFAPLTYSLLSNPRYFFQQIRLDWMQRMPWIWLLLTSGLILMVLLVHGLNESSYSTAIGFAFFPLLCWFILQTRPPSGLVAIPVFVGVFLGLSLNGMGGLPHIITLPDLIRSLLLVGGLAVMCQVLSAITAERTRLIQGFQEQARTDFLTGLRNDRAFTEDLRAALDDRSQSDRAPDWLVYLRVLEADRIEELLGFEASHALERQLAARLMGTTGPRAMPARIADATFVLLIPAESTAVLYRKLESLYTDFDGSVLEPGGHQTQIRVTVGAAPLDGNLEDPIHYLSAATQAAHQAEQHSPRIHIIENTRTLISERHATTQQIERLKSALTEERLELFAQRIQPFLPQDTGLHYEILVRLRERDGELVSPGGFLPVAETFGFMGEIDQWVIRATLRTLAANPTWLESTAKCAINLAGTSLSNPELVAFIDQELRVAGVPPAKISFEITETEQIGNRSAAVAQVRAMRELGCSVSLDDFGTGLATFDYLRSFELDFVKIDGIFVRDLLANHQDQSMVRAICEVARSMGLRTIAEFVEGEDLIEALRQLGVDYGQGFGIARPAPIHELFEQPAA